MDKFTAIIPAAGQGKRMKGDRNKQFLLLEDSPIIVHTLRVFQECPVIQDIVVVCGAGEVEYYLTDIIPGYGITKPVAVVAGGDQRQDSVFQGLQEVPAETGYVMIHDGARPFVTLDLINELAEGVMVDKAVVPGVPVKDTIKRTDPDGYIIETPKREGLWHVQTPQVFELKLIRKAYSEAFQAGFYGTDDASLVERMGIPVRILPGSYENIKITTPDDLIVAEMILKRRDGG